MYRNFNLYAYAVRLLPPFLRKDVIKAVLRVLLKPLEAIIIAFNGLIDSSDRLLTHNSFTIYLERFLNNLFNVEGQIYISDFIDDTTVYLSKKEEMMDYDLMSFKEEELPTLVLPSERPGILKGRFIVHIPTNLDTEENRRLIAMWVNYYKYAGTNYTIEAYE